MCKICTKCNIEKQLSEFSNRTDSKDGKRNYCSLCQSNHNKHYNEVNSDDIAIKRKTFYVKNKERLLSEKKKSYETNRDIYIKRQSEYNRFKKQKDPIYRLKRNLRIMVRKSLKKKAYTKKSQTFIIIGCLQDYFIKYIESKWEPWMNWNNYGKYNGELNYGWDIDHIEPLSNAKIEEEIIRLNHYTNLQPLCSYTNRKIKRDS